MNPVWARPHSVGHWVCPGQRCTVSGPRKETNHAPRGKHLRTPCPKTSGRWSWTCCTINALSIAPPADVVAEEVVGFADEEEKDLLLLIDGKVVRRGVAEVATLIYPEPEVAENAEGNPNP